MLEAGPVDAKVLSVFDFDGTYDPTGIHNAKADAPVVATSGRTVSNAVR